MVKIIEQVSCSTGFDPTNPGIGIKSYKTPQNMVLLQIQNLSNRFQFVFGILTAILSIYCLVDLLRSTFKNPWSKFIWIIIVFIPIIGPVSYLIINKKYKTLYSS